MIKYLGSKRLLTEDILSVVKSLPDVRSVLDLFSGTSRVGYVLKGAGYQVRSNDHNAYAEVLARCYVQSDVHVVTRDAMRLVDELNKIPGSPGYFTNTFCEKSKFFQPKNGERIDAIREAIAAKSLDPELEAVLLTSLMEAADRVDSTTGIQMAYLKQWAPRSFNSLELRVPLLLATAKYGKGRSHRLDAFDAVNKITTDVVYIDPPYNQHKYLGNYHIWESLILWDKPEIYGIACKRVDCKTRTSVFNSKQDARDSLQKLVQNVRAKHIVLSFSNEGYISKSEMESMLSERGEVRTIEIDFQRYVGAKIGIHNPSGEKTGTISHTTNKEYLYTVSL